MEIWPEDKIFSSASVASFLLLNVIIHAHKKAKDMVNVENSKIKENFMYNFRGKFYEKFRNFNLYFVKWECLV